MKSALSTTLKERQKELEQCQATLNRQQEKVRRKKLLIAEAQAEITKYSINLQQ